MALPAIAKQSLDKLAERLEGQASTRQREQEAGRATNQRHQWGDAMHRIAQSFSWPTKQVQLCLTDGCSIVAATLRLDTLRLGS